jgi:hypothetical protein
MRCGVLQLCGSFRATRLLNWRGGLFSQEKSRILKTEDWLAERGEFELSGDFARDQ